MNLDTAKIAKIHPSENYKADPIQTRWPHTMPGAHGTRGAEMLCTLFATAEGATIPSRQN